MINFISSFWAVLSVPCGWRTAKLFEPLAGNNHSLLCILLLSAFPIIEPISDRNYSPSLFTQHQYLQQSVFFGTLIPFCSFGSLCATSGPPWFGFSEGNKNANLRMHRCLKGLVFGIFYFSEAVDLLGRYVHVPFVACGNHVFNF